MLYIYSNGISELDKVNFNKILGFASITPGETRYVDLDHEDISTKNIDFIIAISPKSIKAVIRDLTESKRYPVSSLLGKDAIDKENKFFLYCIPLTFMEMLGSQEDKTLTWNKEPSRMPSYKIYFCRYKSAVKTLQRY